ncbi:MAG: arginine--tRNA ligase [Chloroflexi bacterium]|nr:arginine--tRNA ligase [Chloroflexota bacterium]
MLIKNQLAALVKDAIIAAQNSGALPAFAIPDVYIERPQRKELGDYSCSLPLKLARAAKRAPLEIAQAIAAHFPRAEAIAQVEGAPPGFVNITLNDAWIARQVETILAQGARYGDVEPARRDALRIQVEYVSANPTGPLHIGGGRNGALGDTLANVLNAAGHNVQREFYINDNGTQVRLFGESIFARYAQALGRDESFPEKGYQGAYVIEMGKQIAREHNEKFLRIPRAQAVRELGRLGIAIVLDNYAKTLARMGVRFDNWFSERSLHESGLFAQVFQILQDKGLTAEKDGATWFAAQELGEDKDAVLIRSPQVIAEPDERPTYLASDVAYVWNKLVVRNFDRAIYIWGADHHGDVPRVLAATRALGLDPARAIIILHQFVNLKRGGELIKMSKRAGEFVTMDELLDEVGADAVRFMLIAQHANTTMDFDLELAKKQSDENPVFYVQYAHARISSILKKAIESGALSDPSTLLRASGGDVALLTHPAELDLIREILRLPEIVELVAAKLEPHHLPHYAISLAGIFHAFYKQCRVVSSDPADAAITRARLKLVAAAQNALARTLNLIGVRAPETM